MKARVLIGFLLACGVAALPVADNINEISKNVINEEPPVVTNYMLDDDGQYVPIDENADDPETVEETKKDLSNRVFFFLHTRDYPSEGFPLYLDDETTLAESKFDPAKPTRIVTHGWINSRNSAACTLIRDAYLKHDDYNVIVIDWSKITFRPYFWATRRVKMVGEYVARMINFLEDHGLDPTTTTIVGHSLGAHIAGLAALNSRGQMKYVVGLDPALPGFALAGKGERISSGDADYVEIIHTNAGILGYLSAIGDSDFYPNGGTFQLGCLVDLGGACSHARSYKFFAESITTDVGFHAKKCNGFLQFKLGLCKDAGTWIMGGHKHEFNGRGKFYLSTKAFAPYAKGKI